MPESKYYSLFISEEYGEEILNERLGGLTFEDHYWHMACLAYYFKKTNQDELEKHCLSELCDLNYVYNALKYYETLGVLPINYKQYITPFNDSMINEKINTEIERFNKLDRKKKNRKYWFNSLYTLLVVPLMLFLMLVCKLDSSISIIISIVFLFVIQTITNPFMENSRIRQFLKNKFGRNKNKEVYIPKELDTYFKYLDRFVKIVNEEHYKALAMAKDQDKIDELVKTIKEKKIRV